MAGTASGTIAANPIQGVFAPTSTWGSQTLSINQLIQVPANQAGITIPNGTAAYQIDRIGLFSANLTNATPGTTDTFDLNLASLTDPSGATFTDMLKPTLLVVWVETLDGKLVMKVSGANDFLGFFNSISTTQINVGGAISDAGGNTVSPPTVLHNFATAGAGSVSGTTRLIRFYMPSGTACNFRGEVWGRHA